MFWAVNNVCPKIQIFVLLVLTISGQKSSMESVCVSGPQRELTVKATARTATLMAALLAWPEILIPVCSARIPR